MTKLSFGPEQYVDQLRWVASLSNGQEVWQDDGNPEADIFSAWIRLKHYLAENQLDITRLRVEFRSHIEEVPANQAGYFFSLGASRDFYSEDTWHNYILGWIDEENQLNKVTFKTPELICTMQERVNWSPNDIRVVMNGKKSDKQLLLPI